jgi:methionyl-tRNA formyltransferase
MGTPDFAVPCLEVLAAAGHEIAGVVTQPDRPRGRGHKLTPPPVKVLAQAKGLQVYQPERIKHPDFVGTLQELAPEMIVVVAFGQLLSKEILTLPKHGCVNVHASLLPKYRGAAPIHWAVINGEKETGVTIMYMDEGLDTGDMILRESIPIEAGDTTGTVHDKLSVMGARLLVEAAAQIAAGAARRVPQDNAESTYAPLLTKEVELIPWEKKAAEVRNLIRGLNPWPGAFTYYEGQVMKIWSAQGWEEGTAAIGAGVAPDQNRPGQVTAVLPKSGFVVQTGDGRLLVTEVQLQGSRRMPAADFVHGRGITAGIILGPKQV